MRHSLKRMFCHHWQFICDQKCYCFVYAHRAAPSQLSNGALYLNLTKSPVTQSYTERKRFNKIHCVWKSVFVYYCSTGTIRRERPSVWMANRTVKDAKNIHGTNPQYLIEKIIRSRIYDSKFWKEQCFALTAELLVDKGSVLIYSEPTVSTREDDCFNVLSFLFSDGNSVYRRCFRQQYSSNAIPMLDFKDVADTAGKGHRGWIYKEWRV